MSAEVTIYTTGRCSYCIAAKRLLDAKGLTYREIRVESRPELRRWLVEATAQRTVPQVFINGVSIGGHSELAELERGGDLDTKLQMTPSPEAPTLPT